MEGDTGCVSDAVRAALLGALDACEALMLYINVAVSKDRGMHTHTQVEVYACVYLDDGEMGEPKRNSWWRENWTAKKRE